MTSVHFSLTHAWDYGYSVFSPNSLGTLIILGYDNSEVSDKSKEQEFDVSSLLSVFC